MAKNLLKPAKGRLLVSAPALNDVFKRSVILLAEHNENGSVGFIVNKQLDVKLNDIVDDFPPFDAKVYLGGPVQQDMLNFVHKCGDQIQSGFEIGKGIYWGGNFEIFKLLAESGSLNPEDFRFFLGYSGWSPNQLDGELDVNSWYVANSNQEDIFNDDVSHVWSNVLKRMGGEYTIISTFPDDPSLN
jgi:putative transcriptional regulator